MNDQLKKLIKSSKLHLLLGLLGFYLFFSYVLIAPLVQKTLPWVGEHFLASELTIQKIQYHPFDLAIDVDGIEIKQPSGGRLLGVSHLSANLEASGLLKFAWHLKSIQIDNPELNVEINKNGELNWTNLIAKINENSDPENKKIARLIIDHLLIKDGALHYVNQQPQHRFSSTLKPISMTLNEISTLPTDRGDYLISAKLLDQDATFKWKGTFALNPLSSNGQIEVNRLSVVKVLDGLGFNSSAVKLTNGFVNTQLNYDFQMVEMNGTQYPIVNLMKPEVSVYDLSARMGNAANLQLDAIRLTLPKLTVSGQHPEQVQINKLDAKVGKVNLTNQNQALFSLSGLELHNISFDTKTHQLNLEKVIASQGDVSLVRGANGTTNIATFMNGLHPASPHKKSNQSALRIGVGQLLVKDWAAHIKDLSLLYPMALDFKSINLDSKPGVLDLHSAWPFHVRFNVASGGDVELTGKATASPFNANIKLNVKGLAIKPFSSYLNQHALLKIDDGLVNLNGDLTAAEQQATSVKFKGAFSLNRLVVKESETANNFLSWDELSTKTLTLGVNPNQLYADEVRLVNPIGKLIIGEDKVLNVTKLMRTKSSSGTAKIAAKNASAGSDFPVSIDRFVMKNADLEFADLSLKPKFGAQINTLNGVINGLSTNQRATAQLELNGRVDDYGAVSIRGGIQPFHANEFTDLKLSFANLEMNKLTPYSGKFAGRKIQSGKLSADFEYKIKNHQLAGVNKFVINKIKLGEHVDSRDASNLPLDMAIFLLEDKDGLIDLDIPISGSLDDPKFSYGKIVWKALENVLGKLVTAPFRVFGKLLGVETSKLDGINFEAGSSSLLPPEMEKLKTISEGMNKKAKMILTIAPAYHLSQDTAALKEVFNRRDVAKEMGLNINEGEILGPIDMSNPKVQVAVENVIKARAGQGASTKALNLIKGYLKKMKPDDASIVSSKVEQLNSTAIVTENDYLDLAKMRAQVIQDYLINKLGIDKSRIKILETAPDQLKLKLGLGMAQD